MTITERLSGIVDFLTQGLTRDEEEEAFDFGGEEEYVEDGNALRVTKPEYSTTSPVSRSIFFSATSRFKKFFNSDNGITFVTLSRQIKNVIYFWELLIAGL